MPEGTARRLLVNEALVGLNELFNSIYADSGRVLIAPEKLLRAMLLQVFFYVRSERQLMEQIGYNLLFRWFIGLALDDDVWDRSVFTKNRDRLVEHAVSASKNSSAGQDDRAHQAGGLPRPQTRGPAVQADHDREPYAC